MSQIKESSESQRTRHQRKRSKAGDQSIPPFLAKTYDILQKQNHDNLICWNPEGNGFVVKNITEFTEQILPRYFKHNNYASFVRQLNMYGFHKVKSNTSDAQVFTHERFLRNQRESLKEIKRKVNAEGNNEKNEELRLDLVNNSKSQSELIGEIRHLKKKQDELEKVVDVLAEQNKQILQDNRRLWKRMKKTMEKQQKKFQNILLLFLLNGGHNPQDIILDKQQIEGNEGLNHALLPVEEPKRQNIMDAFLSRFNTQHKNNYKDQLYLQNNGEHMKLLNSLVNNLSQNKDDSKYMLEYQNEPQAESVMSPLSYPQEEIPMSPTPLVLLNEEDEDNLGEDLSLEKGISAQFPSYNYQLASNRSDFMDDK